MAIWSLSPLGGGGGGQAVLRMLSTGALPAITQLAPIYFEHVIYGSQIVSHPR